MPLPASLLPTTCNIYRPYTAASPVASNVPCQLVCDMPGGQVAGAGGLVWTHTLLVNSDVDLRDGCTRAAGADAVTYADGDGVRIPAGAGSTRYVVVWVECVQRGGPNEYKRAYLLRDTATWPGP
jgi:hypothetical protein